MKKRVLIITYYWPPSGGSGVQRWLKFAKYLPEAGWEPVIFTPENPDFDLKDESLEKEISNELEVMKFPIWEPYQLLDRIRGKKESHPGRVLEQKEQSFIEKAAIWLRANLMVPDPRVFWVKPSVKFLTELIEKGQFQAIITTGPPHSMHLIGRDLKRKTGVFWLADFRDPWSQWEFLDKLPMQNRVRDKHKKLEQEVLNEADVVTTISPTFQDDLEQLARRKINLITNGFDETDIPQGFSVGEKKGDSLHLVYTGIIDSIRNPMPLLKAMREEFSKEKGEVKFTFVGRVSDQVREEIAADSWLLAHVHFAGYVSHQEVFGFYEKADALALILTNTKNAKGNIPGKLFEYMATTLPILALGDPEGDSAKILKEAEAGQVFSHSDHVAIQVSLRKLFERSGKAESARGIEQYSRRNLSIQLAKLLDADSVS
ncbi:glycosyltransferase family 4 protein [Algoriphagus aquimarinus]|uniref:Glycosyltransferase involved in cell wall bisynthesis n=1 Tax=Algoriphagus aquimarinus TaxID=237018 RepID=A0A1I0XFF4_9BACT|nr:glycosyltransferase family 4 protein [Algoriphagus aquimarinus]SFA99030.1 Glycosyltransferase involved in cell wall bisynthesis [Algoriphagus aquimarinus]|tara:strand:+ start:98145 stop:99434 length:1290 start_codon:yes stop_codon:yes gene_type:complete